MSLRYMTPAAPNWKARSGLIAPLVEQVIFTLIGASILDGGIAAQAMGRLSIAFWIGAITIWLRRSELSRGEKLYLRFGLPIILFLGVPLYLFIWAKQGVI
jgi:hypothetical protein